MAAIRKHPQMPSTGSLVDQGLQLHCSQTHQCERGHASEGSSFWLLVACSGDDKAGFFQEGAGKTLLTGVGLEGFSCILETSLAQRDSKIPPTQPSFPLPACPGSEASLQATQVCL